MERVGEHLTDVREYVRYLVRGSEPEMTRGTVLIVEDEPEVADILEFNLRANGFETRVAPDGLTACRLVGEQPPDLMLLDLLPCLTDWDLAVTKPGGMTGAECLAKGLPIVLLGRPLPGPETLNQGWLLVHGGATAAPDPRDLSRVVAQVLSEVGGGSEGGRSD